MNPDDAAPEPDAAPELVENRSGLRNPGGAVRAAGAAALATQGLVLLLAIQPLRMLGAAASSTLVITMVTLSVASFALAGQLRRPWVWAAGWVLPAAQFVAGLLVHPALTAIGVLCGLMWLYVLHVRRTVLG